MIATQIINMSLLENQMEMNVQEQQDTMVTMTTGVGGNGVGGGGNNKNNKNKNKNNNDDDNKNVVNMNEFLDDGLSFGGQTTRTTTANDEVSMSDSFCFQHLLPTSTNGDRRPSSISIISGTTIEGEEGEEGEEDDEVEVEEEDDNTNEYYNVAMLEHLNYLQERNEKLEVANGSLTNQVAHMHTFINSALNHIINLETSFKAFQREQHTINQRLHERIRTLEGKNTTDELKKNNNMNGRPQEFKRSTKPTNLTEEKRRKSTSGEARTSSQLLQQQQRQYKSERSNMSGQKNNNNNNNNSNNNVFLSDLMNSRPSLLFKNVHSMLVEAASNSGIVESLNPQQQSQPSSSQQQQRNKNNKKRMPQKKASSTPSSALPQRQEQEKQQQQQTDTVTTTTDPPTTSAVKTTVDSQAINNGSNNNNSNNNRRTSNSENSTRWVTDLLQTLPTTNDGMQQ